MKRILLSGIIMLSSLVTLAQTDTTGTGNGDTVRVGNFIIIRKKGVTDKDSTPKRNDYTIINIPRKRAYNSDEHPAKRRTVSTNYFIFDLGFANYRDNTDYNSPAAMDFLHYDAANQQPFRKDDLKLITGKSSNVNLWLFMQKLNITGRVLNLKYGLGLEMYNFRYKENISYNENPAFISRDTVNFSKNKLYVGYATVPFMINIDPTPNKRHGFSLSAGVSAGYRIGSHTKQISDERGKVKNHGEFDLDPWRFTYVAELGLGPARLYGSYSINPLHQDGLKQYPYAIGLRFSNW
jgi:hypothetical protein